MENLYSNNDGRFCKALQYLSGAWACFFVAAWAGINEYLPSFSRLFEPVLYFLPIGAARGTLSLLLQLSNLYLLTHFLFGRFLALGRLNSPLSLVPLYATAGLVGWVFSDWAAYVLQGTSEARSWIALAALLTFANVALQVLWSRLERPISSSSESLAWIYGPQVITLLIVTEIINNLWIGWSSLELLVGIALIGVYQVVLHQTFQHLRHREFNAYLATWNLFFSSYGIFIRILRILTMLFMDRKKRRD